MADHSQTVAPAYEYALAMAASQCAVLPIGVGQKYPPFDDWQNKATNSIEQIALWYDGHPEWGLGWKMGLQPDGRYLVAIDVDAGKDGLVSMRAFAEEHDLVGEFAGTTQAVTGGGGRHFIFVIDPSRLVLTNRARLLPGVDIRAEGGQIVCSPSIHPTTGKKYAWRNAPWDVAPQVASDGLVAALTGLVTPAPQLRVVPQLRQSPIRHDETSPADWVRANLDWHSYLLKHGWVHVGGELWKRPGKTDKGHSAVLHNQGDGPLVVFSTEVPVELERLGRATHGQEGFSVSLFSFIAAYEYQGMERAFAREIGEQHLRRDDAPRSEPGGVADTDTRQASPSSGYLTDEFWASRSFLGEIRQAARARRVGPDAVLLNVLVRFSALVPPNYWLPPLVGSRGSLDLLGCIVGVTGVGKSRAMSCSKDIVPPTDQGVRWDLPLGSGEGIPQAYMVTKVDDNGKPTKEQVVGMRAAHFIVDEGVAMAKQSGRAGVTVIPTINSAITGEALGQANASQETRRIIPAGTVRFACVMNIQEENAHLVFTQELVSIGFTGRIIFVRAGDPTAPDEPPAWPNITLPRIPIIASGVELTYHPDIVAEIDNARLAVLRLNSREGSGDSHSMLLKCKISSLFALIDGRRNVELSDWAIAGALIDNSSVVFQALDSLRRDLDSRALRAAGHRRADIEEVVADRAEIKAAARRREWVVKQVLRFDSGVTLGELRRRADSKDRPHVEESVETALSEGRIKYDGEKYTKP